MAIQDDATKDPTTFGAQLLAAIQKEGLPLSGFDYALIQEMKGADREETIRILRDRSPLLGYAAIQALKRESPTEIATRLMRMHPLAASQGATTMLMMIALMT